MCASFDIFCLLGGEEKCADLEVRLNILKASKEYLNLEILDLFF